MRPGFLRGVGQALLIPACFALVGIGLAEADARPPERVPGPGLDVYPSLMVPESESEPEVPATAAPRQFLVDGFNVVSVGLLATAGPEAPDRGSWWRREHRDALVERARRFDDSAADVWIVFDGDDPSGNWTEASPRTVFAPSADAWLVDRVRGAPDPALLTVVTADRRLANRVRSRGAAVVSPGDFLARCRA